MSKAPSWGLAQFGLLGLLIHALGIYAFVIVSKSAPLLVWKLLIIGATGIASALLLWVSIRRRRTILSAIACAAVLAVDFELAFHLVGLFGFRGLLGEAASFSYVASLSEAIGVIFILYLIPAIAMYWIIAFQNRRVSV